MCSPCVTTAHTFLLLVVAASVGQWDPRKVLLSNAPALCQPARGTFCSHLGAIFGHVGRQLGPAVSIPGHVGSIFGPILVPDELVVVQGKKEIAKALRVFVDHNNYPVLVHCIHGKDRTGLIVMLIMLLCSVEPEVSPPDSLYAHSHQQCRTLLTCLGTRHCNLHPAPPSVCCLCMCAVWLCAQCLHAVQPF